MEESRRACGLDHIFILLGRRERLAGWHTAKGTGTHRSRVTGLLVTNITISITTGFLGALGWDLKGFTSPTVVPEQFPTLPPPGRWLEIQKSVPPSLTFHQYASDKVPGSPCTHWSGRMQAAGFPEPRHPTRD